MQNVLCEPNMVIFTYNLSIWEVDAGGLGVQSHSQVPSMLTPA